KRRVGRHVFGLTWVLPDCYLAEAVGHLRGLDGCRKRTRLLGIAVYRDELRQAGGGGYGGAREGCGGSAGGSEAEYRCEGRCSCDQRLNHPEGGNGNWPVAVRDKRYLMDANCKARSGHD